MATIRTLDGYPTSWGNIRASIVGHAGPASYTVVTAVAGTVPALGGDTVQAVEFGMKYLDAVICMDESDDAAFAVEAFPLSPSNPASGAALGGVPRTTFGLRWISRVTALVGGQNQTAGLEVVATTNLSGEFVRLIGLGPK